MASFSSLIGSRLVMTVRGTIPYKNIGITDAHNHVWIDPVSGADPTNPILNQFDSIVSELIEYRTEGGHTLLDCQPEGCGRNGNQLLALSKASDVNIIACSGFHRKKYYPKDHWFWKSSTEKICDFITNEITNGLLETIDTSLPVKAGFIKIALESTWLDCPQAALEGAAAAASKNNALLEIHTEKGALAEKICLYFMDMGLSPTQLVLCHLDKRPDFVLHKELARLGVLLEYDTFYRPKYDPKINLWPLLEQMAQANLSTSVALATDMAEADLYHFLGNGAGLASLPGEVQKILIEKGFPQAVRKQMLGDNIARRLVGIH